VERVGIPLIDLPPPHYCACPHQVLLCLEMYWVPKLVKNT